MIEPMIKLAIFCMVYVASALLLMRAIDRDHEKRDRYLQKRREEEQEQQRILDFHKQETEIRQQYPAVAEAYERYQLMLELYQHQHRVDISPK